MQANASKHGPQTPEESQALEEHKAQCLARYNALKQAKTKAISMYERYRAGGLNRRQVEEWLKEQDHEQHMRQAINEHHRSLKEQQ